MAIRFSDAISASELQTCEHVDQPSSVSSEHIDQPQKSFPNQREGSSGLSTRGRLRRWITGVMGVGALGMVLCGVTGCTSTAGAAKSLGDCQCLDDFMIGYRNRAMAEKAWHCQKDQFCHKKHGKEFKAGFQEGFMEVANGGNGCIPAIAPKEYWGWRYQSAQGQGAVNSWFEGYPMGVKAAEQLGVGNWGEVRTTGFAPPAAAQTTAPGVNPFYGPVPQQGMSPTMFDGEIIDGSAAPMMDVPSSSDAPTLDTTPIGSESDAIEFGFDSASTDSGYRESGFGDEPVFTPEIGEQLVGPSNESSPPGNQVSHEVESAVAQLSGDVDIDDVFGSPGSSQSSVSTDLPFSFE